MFSRLFFFYCFAFFPHFTLMKQHPFIWIFYWLLFSFLLIYFFLFCICINLKVYAIVRLVFSTVSSNQYCHHRCRYHHRCWSDYLFEKIEMPQNYLHLNQTNGISILFSLFMHRKCIHIVFAYGFSCYFSVFIVLWYNSWHFTQSFRKSVDQYFW